MKSEIVIGTDDEESFPKKERPRRDFRRILSTRKQKSIPPFSYSLNTTTDGAEASGSSAARVLRWESNGIESLHEKVEESSDEERPPIEPIPIADMALHMNHLRQAILLAAPTSAFKEDALAYQFASIEASETERVDKIDDLLDIIVYWAMEESTTFIGSPSQLAEVEAPEALVFCLFSQRPRLITKALVIMKYMLEHPQTASELCYIITRYYYYYCTSEGVHHPIRNTYLSLISAFPLHEKERGESSSETNNCSTTRGTAVHTTTSSSSSSSSSSFSSSSCPPSSYDNILFLLTFFLQQYEGLPDLLVAAVNVLSSLCCMKRVSAETILRSGVISLLATGTLTHVDHQCFRVATAAFFSHLVRLPRGAHTGNVGSCHFHPPSSLEDTAPLSSLVCYAEELLSIIIQTFVLGWTNSQIRTSCLRFICVCSAYPPNRLPLVKEKALVLTLKAFPDLLKRTAPAEELEDALDILLRLSDYLDDFQCAYTIKYCIAEVLRCRGEEGVLRRAVLFITFLTKSFAGNEWVEDRGGRPCRTPLPLSPSSSSSSPPSPTQALFPVKTSSPPSTSPSSRLFWSELVWHSPLGGRRKPYERAPSDAITHSLSCSSSAGGGVADDSCKLWVSLLESCSIPLLLIHLADFCFRHPNVLSPNLSSFPDSLDSLISTSSTTSMEEEERGEHDVVKSNRKMELPSSLSEGKREKKLNDGGRSVIEKSKLPLSKKDILEEDMEKDLIASEVEEEIRVKERELGTLARLALQLIWKIKTRSIE